MLIRVFSFWLLLLTATFAQTPPSLGTASITGRITFKEQPLPGMMVTLESARRSFNAQASPLSMKTDTDGRYRLTGITAGQYSVSPRVLAYAIPYDGAFTITNLAPGKYWLLARAVPDDESDEKPAKPVAWDANERAKLRQTAEAANQAITLMACQRAKEFVLKFEAAVK